ncbi:MAG TPA: hypothetical protein DCW51_07370 [Clostridium sp.]|nr:hypothetical protein [Clostridium sp.]
MADFNSLGEAYSDIIQNLGVALRDALEKAKEVAYEYIIKQWYGKYDQGEYERLGLMLDSLQTEYKLNGSSLEATLFIRNDILHPSSNSWNKKPVSFSYLYDWFSGYREEQDILDYTQEQLDDLNIFVNIIRDTLKKAGYDFS